MIDIVVVNYRTPGDLRNFLASLRSCTLPFQLFIMDVQPERVLSMEERYELFVLAGEPEGAYTDTPTNIGYARACNAAAAMGSNPALAFFNADVGALPGSIERCYETLMSRPGIAVVGPKQLDRVHRFTHAGIVRKGRAGCHDPLFRKRDKGQRDVCEDVDSVSGSAYFTKRSIWDEMAACPLYVESDPNSEGAFLQTNHYFEETWYSYHARAHGYRVVYEGRATMIHLWHRASPVGGWAERQFGASEKKFLAACDHHRIECRP